ncbi:enoyl-CoA hydratase/carnithine racemase [Bacillus ectoiniformans]|uniref:enoyl-CoA hydratase n=1 Tax=Bacillus ectoiniformans TaxID=1494429 RepID=UPI00195A6237|nr:enoyl-CoA hydratase [Bacillus ectoiniformans]MBM7650105.1 enoyl-CoA hydratase/carnithine racemase [Bacillus ectoiniformans]
MAETVIIQKPEDGIAVIKLNRSNAANALSRQMLYDLHEALNEIKFDTSIRAVIITGEGEKAFCAGADLKERKGMEDAEVKRIVSLIGSTINEVEALPQPVIAAINGAAFGGGLELALACDIRIASKEAKLGLTETSLAIIPGAGGTQRLPRLIGLGKAKELIFTAQRLTGEQAEDIGLVEYAVQGAELMEWALNLAKQMVKNAPLALIQAKTAINKGMQTDLATGLKIEELAYSALIPTEDRMEGLRAFGEKRPPVYQGK